LHIILKILLPQLKISIPSGGIMSQAQPVCPNCHNPIRPGARFCPTCGFQMTQQPATYQQSAPQYTPVAQPQQQKKSRWWIWVLLVIVLCIALVGCLVLGYFFIPGVSDKVGDIGLISFTTSTPVIEKTKTSELENTPTPEIKTPELEITETDVVTEIPPTEAPAEGYNFTYDNITMVIPYEVASSAEGETIEGYTTGAYWEVLPDYKVCNLEGYPLSITFHSPIIQVFPVDEYVSLNPDVSTVIDQLNSLLASHDYVPTSLPFLPYWNAGALFTARIEYLDFQNGSGVRYLTQYGQAFWPINNYDMFYTFQGITKDGKYYISAILPISHPNLPQMGDEYTGSMDDLYANFDGYLSSMLPEINGWGDDEFTPTISGLDALIESIYIK